MKSWYSLWDVDVGTSLGTYDTEAEALAVVHQLLLAYGVSYANVLDLSLQREDGEWEPVAAGQVLAEQARIEAVVGGR